MKPLGLGTTLNGLKNQILKIRREINEIDESFKSIPEVIETTNILRENESLRLSNKKKSELISFYEQYTKQIESIVSSVFDIQNDLRDIVKTQSELIGSSKKKSSKKLKKTTRRKKRRSR